MGFSNQVIIPVSKYKPHIVKMEGLWRVSPYDHKRLWTKRIFDRWDDAHALACRLNNIIQAEQEAAKERQREWKRKQKEV
jgi:hypothetical protein